MKQLQLLFQIWLVITKNQKDKIIRALNEINQELMNEKFKFSDSYEDIHMNIEMALKSKVGEIAGKIHTGKSRNDQVATDLKMWIREKLDEIVKRIKQIQKTIIRKSEENMNVIMPGFTHLQNAQPVLFSHYLMSFFEMINRDKIRSIQLLKNLNECPLGSGAIAGTNFFEIDRFYLEKIHGNYNAYMCNPMIAIQKEGFSDIENKISINSNNMKEI